MSKKLCLAKRGLTKRALDAGDFAAFPSIFVASRFLCPNRIHGRPFTYFLLDASPHLRHSSLAGFAYQ